MEKGKFIRALTVVAVVGTAALAYRERDHWPVKAMTLPVTNEGGVVVFFTDHPNNFIRDHEANHQKQIRQMGPAEFSIEYLQYPCEMEQKAGENENHPVCKFERGLRSFQAETRRFVNTSQRVLERGQVIFEERIERYSSH